MKMVGFSPENFFKFVILLTNLFVRFDKAWATQSFTQQPTDTAVNVGTASVTINCAVAQKTGVLFWFKDDTLLGSDDNVAVPGHSRYSLVGDASQGEYNLQITEVTLDDDGMFHCQVARSGTDSELSSSSARLTVQRAPSTVTIASSETMSVSEAEPKDITCTATSANPAATITWYREDVKLEGAVYSSKPTDDDPSGKLFDAESVLTITPTIHDHDVIYECRASNPANTDPITDSITLDVQHAPRVDIQTIPEAIREETTAVCRCIVDANPRSVTYVWTKNGEVLTGKVDSQIALLVTKEDHEATIKCSAENAIGSAEAEMQLNVLYGPRLIETPKSVSVDDGDPAYMTCIPDGNPTPTTKWTRLGSRATLSTMQRLQFDSVRQSDVDVYVCTVTVPDFDPVTSIARLDINSIPVIDSEPIQKAKLGKPAELQCHTDSMPTPFLIMWEWVDGELETGTDGSFTAQQVNMEGGGVTSYLRIDKVRSRHFDDYNCTVWNDEGVTSTVITLEQEELDMIVYIIIGVVCASVFVFIVTISFMCYCRRRLHLKKTKTKDSAKEVIPVEIIPQVMSLKDALDSGKKPTNGDKLDSDGSQHSSGSRPRYAQPHEFVNRKRNSWEDPAYIRGHPNEYMEPHQFDRHPSPPWNDGYDDRGYSEGPTMLYDDDPYIRPEDPYPRYREFHDEPVYQDHSVHSQRSRYDDHDDHDDHDDYIDPRDFRDPPYARYESDHEDENPERYNYDHRESDKNSEMSYDSKDRLQTNV